MTSMRNFFWGCFAMSDRLIARTRAQAFSSRNGIHLESEYVKPMGPPSRHRLDQIRPERRRQIILLGESGAQVRPVPLGVLHRLLGEVGRPIGAGPPHPV